MKRILPVLSLLFVLAPAVAAAATPSYSTGAVGSYMANCGVGPDLPAAVPEAANIRCWYSGGAGCGSTVANPFPLVTSWNDGDVWGSDFRDGIGTADTDSSGGSDLPAIYFYAGHGRCKNPPTATSRDFIIVCGNSRKTDVTDIGAFSRWGSASGGHLQFAFIDASCPMDLVSITNNWPQTFQGLHVATGHSGDQGHDTLDSASRGGQFAAYTSGNNALLPQLSVGDAWMAAGLIDVDPGVCAVVIAVGADAAEAVDRRDNERVTDGRGDPVSNWCAWRWVCS